MYSREQYRLLRIDKRLHLLVFVLVVGGILLAGFILSFSPSFILFSPPEVQLTWIDNSDNEDAFLIQALANDPTFLFGTPLTYAVAADTTLYGIPLTELIPDTTYYFRIAASNSFGISPYTPSSFDSPVFITTPLATCTGAAPLCNQQQGVCAGSVQYCAGTSYATCTQSTYDTYASLTFGALYESSEVSCGDGFDNDCNGLADLSDPACVLPPVVGSLLVNGVPSTTAYNHIPNTVTILGQYFDTVISVTVGSVPVSYTLISPGELQISLPAIPGFTGTLGVAVITSAGIDATTITFLNPAPILTSLSQTSFVDPTLATTVTLQGTNIIPGVSLVEISLPSYLNVPAILCDSSLCPMTTTTVTVPLPGGIVAPGTYSVRVVNPVNSFSTPLTFTVSYLLTPPACPNGNIACPTVSTVLVTAGGNGQTVANLGGQLRVEGMLLSGAPFNQNNVVILVRDGLLPIPLPTFMSLQTVPSLAASIPPTVPAGTYTVGVSDTQTSLVTLSQYTIDVVELAPTITSISPSSFVVNQPIAFTLTGTYFYPMTSIELLDPTNTVLTGGTTTYVSSTQLDYVHSGLTPAGTYSLRVVNPAGSLATSSLAIIPLCGNGASDTGEQCGEPGLTCGAGSTCTTALCQCVSSGAQSGTGGGAGNPGGTGGGGGGGGSSSSGTTQTPQCRDGRDNDLDGLTDYPLDPGCSTATDSSEVNVPPSLPLGGSTPNAPSPSVTPLSLGSEQVRGFRLVFWTVVVVLGGGIMVVALLIIRTLRQRARIMALAQHTVFK